MSPSSPCAYLIAGAGGMLGTALQLVLAEQGASVHAPSEAEFDITDPVRARHLVAHFTGTLAPGQRGVLLNAAAFTDVERAEELADRAYLVNAQGPAILARTARAAGISFVHVSTDFVFDGRKPGAYTEADEPHPLSVYGASKLAGEIVTAEEDPDALIVRTAWVFGPGGHNFPTKILEAARTRPILKAVTDEIGSPTYTVDLARSILGLVDAEATGLLHLAGSGSCSRFEFAGEILQLADCGDVVLEPVTSDAFPTRAMRPMNSVLDCSKAEALGVVMPSWTDALQRFIGGIAESGTVR